MVNAIIFYSVFCFFVQVGYCKVTWSTKRYIPLLNLILAPIVTPIMIGYNYAAR